MALQQIRCHVLALSSLYHDCLIHYLQGNFNEPIDNPDRLGPIRDLILTLTPRELASLKYYLQGDLNKDPARFIDRVEAMADLEARIAISCNKVRVLKAAREPKILIKEAVDELISLKVQLSSMYACD